MFDFLSISLFLCLFALQCQTIALALGHDRCILFWQYWLYRSPGRGNAKLVHDVYAQGAWLPGLINSSSAIGSIPGPILVSQASRLKRRGLLAYLSLLVSCVGITIFGLPFPSTLAPIIAPVASVCVGFGLSCFNTVWFTMLQEMIPGDKLGRAIRIDSPGSFAMLPIAGALGGLVTDHLGPALAC